MHPCVHELSSSGCAVGRRKKGSPPAHETCTTCPLAGPRQGSHFPSACHSLPWSRQVCSTQGSLTDEVGRVGGPEEVGQVQPFDEGRVHGDSSAPAPWVVCRWRACQEGMEMSSSPPAEWQPQRSVSASQMIHREPSSPQHSLKDSQTQRLQALL
jgi:hypothetical protein